MILEVSFQVVPGSNVSGCGTSLAILLYLSLSSLFKPPHLCPIIRFFSPRLSTALNSVTVLAYKYVYVCVRVCVYLYVCIALHILY